MDAESGKDGDAEEDALGRYARLCFSIYAAHHAFNRAYAPLLEEMGLTYPQYLVLAALWTRDRRRVGEIGRALRLESNTLTPLLKRLEAAGLIRRERDPIDERAVIAALTPAGAALEATARGAPARLLGCAGLTPEEAERLAGALDLVRRRLDGGAQDD
ncbi:MarR family transcriptional regulator [Pikeienuella sp. HZG-20]|uniref:MarR family winged helix-turn-helix transcriptional regulator n=1 Tax=Paludibacillus litoralis TaxID=3133267 RepID=UPI0030ED2757